MRLRKRRPGFVSLVLALLLAFGFAVPLAPQPAFAQAGEIDQDEFDELFEEAEDTDPAYGPEDAELEHDPDIVTLAYSELEVSDFVASATFVNPFAGSSQQFDYGIQFRTVTVDDEALYARFIVLSTGVWAVTESGNEELVAQGEYADLDVSRNGENELIVIADGDTIHLGINGDYVGSGELAVEEPGDVAVGTAFLADSFQDGAVTEVLDFTVWSGEVDADPRDDEEENPRDSGDEPQGDDDGPFNNGGRGDDEDEPEDEPQEDPQDDPQDEPEDEPEDDPQDEPDDVPVGTRYDAELFAFHFNYNEEIWQLTDASTTEQLELIQLSNGISSVQIVIGQIWEDGAACAESLLTATLTNLENQGASGQIDASAVTEVADAFFDGTYAIEAVFMPNDAASESDYSTIYIECSPAGTNEYLVGVVHLAPTEFFMIQSIFRDALVITFNAEDAPADEPEDEPRDDDPQDEPK
ncbi:MAG: hypothetical protein M3Y37_08015, partial [Chloroflexota bacterium]|nr:hypothetical protein [Chloroflexota bacterium]